MRSARVPDIAIICFTDLKQDPRPFRQLQFLRSEYRLCAVGLGDPELEGVEFVKAARERHSEWGYIGRRLYRLRHLPEVLRGPFPLSQLSYWTPEKIRLYELLVNRKWDVIIANELSALPLAIALAKVSCAKVLFDAHEYEYGHHTLGESRWTVYVRDRRIRRMLAECLPHVDKMTTVCQGLADAYEKNFGKKCAVITNAPFYYDGEVRHVENDVIRLVHHGGTNPTRRIDNMVRLMDYLDARFTLDLIVIPKPSSSAPSYRNLVRLAESHPRVKLHSPVPLSQVVSTIREYDVGLFLLPAIDFSYHMALPNKLFEFIQARLAVAVWPSPEMARIVREYECGVVAEEFTLKAMAKKLNSLKREDIDHFKQNSAKAAREHCAERNGEVLRSIVRNLLNMA